ncbi:RNA 2',3'-cyclic phosphodiesterase [Thalassotalea psychrophila]|uniref:RNA 2',3'-cyclic phosphodiesterase n=1 Tax=Thalassotalea psychrophila TaxID=3065647 RepID=A0ABY9TY92_9GAMM|nr:RNA 2',3'-cyclic phosphodiesterase [Colwelliaceae bacterium SQ149]
MGRYFFGLNLASAFKQEITNWRELHLPNDTKSVIAENFHITLVFLGMVEQETIQRCITETNNISANRFSILLNSVGFWPKPKVLFLASDDVAVTLSILVNNLTNIVINNGIKLQQRPYIPHLTLCRKAKALPNILAKPNFEIEFNNFCLYESISTDRGVQYKVVQTWPLNGS